jgi:hypothetical protein
MVPCSPDLDLGLFSLELRKNLMNSQRVNKLDQQTAHITTAVANVMKDVLQCI